MKNYRKFILGLTYLLGMFLLAGLQIWRNEGKDLVGLGTLAGGLAGGMTALIWGYNREHEIENKTPNGN